jgi:hypothetical protein
MLLPLKRILAPGVICGCIVDAMFGRDVPRDRVWSGGNLCVTDVGGLFSAF